MNHATPTGGDSPRLPNASRWERSTRDGAPVVLVTVTNEARPALVSPDSWDLFLALGYRPTVFMKGDGKGRAYPGHHAGTPDLVEAYPRDLARTLLAIKLVREEEAGGDKATLDGLHVAALNGDKFDLRDGNLAARPGKLRKGGFVAVADVRRRWKIRFPSHGEGQEPNAVFAAIRRAKRLARKERRGDCDGREASTPHA